MSEFSIELIIIIIVFILIVSFVLKFYSQRKTYPPGPLPLPVIGNLFTLLWNRKHNPFLVIHDCCKPYGKVSTFWFGTIPAVIIYDLEVARNAFNKAECCGRPVKGFRLLGFKTFGIDDDSSDQHTILRKLSIGAIRNLLSTNKLSSLISDSVNEVVNEIISNESNRAFDPELYMPHITIRTMAELTFRRKYSFGHKQLQTIHRSLDAFIAVLIKLFLAHIAPFSRYFLKVNEKDLTEMRELDTYNRRSFETCKLSYKSGMCDNFTNAFLTSRTKMMDEGNNSAEYLTDENIISVLMALLIGGTETTYGSFNWVVLILSHYTEIQRKLREEVDSKLGDKLPESDDRQNFHYLNAFLHEVLRFSAITPLGLLHSTTAEFNICDYTIPKNTIVISNLYAMLNDPIYWKQPEKFMPERFLDSSGLFISSRFPAFVLFSTGRRTCLGERVAHEMLFLSLVCLLQSTRGYRFVLENGAQSHDLVFDTRANSILRPKPYKIILERN